jgi:hypothetical protein
VSVADIRTRYAINYPMCFDDSARERLILGYCKMIYLYFTLPPYNPCCKFQKAELILFQDPYAPCNCGCPKEDNCGKDSYFLFPLVKPLNVFYRLAPTDIDRKNCVSFEVSRQQSHVKIDISKIFQDWMNCKLANSGLLLVGSPKSKDVAFVSGQYAFPWMQPMIRFTCEFKNPTPAFRSIPCDVKVTGLS